MGNYLNAMNDILECGINNEIDSKYGKDYYDNIFLPIYVEMMDYAGTFDLLWHPGIHYSCVAVWFWWWYIWCPWCLFWFCCWWGWWYFWLFAGGSGASGSSSVELSTVPVSSLPFHALSFSASSGGSASGASRSSTGSGTSPSTTSSTLPLMDSHNSSLPCHGEPGGLNREPLSSLEVPVVMPKKKSDHLIILK